MKSDNNIIDDIFKSAKEKGAEQHVIANKIRNVLYNAKFYFSSERFTSGGNVLVECYILDCGLGYRHFVQFTGNILIDYFVVEIQDNSQRYVVQIQEAIMHPDQLKELIGIFKLVYPA